MRQFPILLIAILTLAALPPAVATWYGPGTYEPDTAYDHDGGMMFLEADMSTDQDVKKVYFNAFPSITPGGSNPNVGTLGSRAGSSAVVQWNAQLGVWKDCNGDGYVGTVESAVIEYRNELLPNPTICPPDSLHNDGEWVYEFLHIVPSASPSEFGVIVSPGVAIWGDIGLPGDPRTPLCLSYPLPHGTTSGSGAMIRYLDCLAKRAITTTVNMVDPDGSLGLGFDDPNNPQESDSLLNQHFPVNLFGNPTTGQKGIYERDTGNPAFTTWDCGSETSAEDPVNGGSVVLAPGLDPTVGDPSGSYADGVNQTWGGAVMDCGANNDIEYGPLHDALITSLDARADGTAQAAGKTQSDIVMTAWARFGGTPVDLAELARGFAQNLPLVPAEVSDIVRNMPIPPTGKHTPANLGLQGAAFFVTPVWSAYQTYTMEPATINDLAPDSAQYWSFYARVDPEVVGALTLLMPSPSIRVYGDEACDNGIGPGASMKNDWSCDPAKWNLAESGGTVLVEAQAVGAEYNLRDIDCIDRSPARALTLGCPETPE